MKCFAPCFFRYALSEKPIGTKLATTEPTI